jgi:hypothetical protein
VESSAAACAAPAPKARTKPAMITALHKEFLQYEVMFIWLHRSVACAS